MKLICWRACGRNVAQPCNCRVSGGDPAGKRRARDKGDGSQGVTLSTDHIKPGKVVFKVKNISDSVDHELLLAIADSPDALPMDELGVRVDEDKIKGLKELGDVHPGKSRSTTLTLTAGKYMPVLQRGRPFKAGMYRRVHSCAIDETA